ncbi:hypothetical protein J437_LFUL015718 [Ladona fulva]|uniref:Uncharacterized protein n=1 Tax=Ladona fulva TaxID=123851 RepID=A0A8K0P6D2_LADFU|nr:hypothetical protein J437_LFUL015718 [Ladona fulva]
MARKGHTRGNNRASNELISKIADLNFDRSDHQVGSGLYQDTETTRYIADILSINSRFHDRATKNRQRNGQIAFKETTVEALEKNSLNGRCKSPALRSCIAFEKGDENPEVPHARKSFKSVKNLKKGGEKSCPTCSGSESDLSRERLPTKGKHKKNTTDMKLLMEAVNNLENSDCVSDSSASKKNMTFTNEQLLQIDRQNRILLNKIVESQKKSRKKPEKPPTLFRASSAINRMKKQMEINHNNQILLRKIQQAKPTSPIKRAFAGKQHY